MKRKNFLISAVTLASSLFIMSNMGTVSADEYLSSDQIQEQVSELSDGDFVLALPNGAYIENADGSNNFSEEQVKVDGGQVLSVSDYKTFLANLDISAAPPQMSEGSGFRAAYAPAVSQIIYLGANQHYTSQKFYAQGWRYGESRFAPVAGTGSYLLWTAYGDSGVVVNPGVARVNIYPNQPRYVNSAGNGAYFQTFNPKGGSTYRVDNPV